jgi:hypothetical protein
MRYPKVTQQGEKWENWYKRKISHETLPGYPQMFRSRRHKLTGLSATTPECCKPDSGLII